MRIQNIEEKKWESLSKTYMEIGNLRPAEFFKNEGKAQNEDAYSVFSIDPGDTKSGFLVIKDGKIDHGGKADNLVVVEELKRFLMETPSPNVVIERIESMGMAVGDNVFRTCEWVGRFTQASVVWSAPVHYVYRRDEKLCLCGNPRAKDANIRRALIDRYATFDMRTGRGTKKNPDALYGFKADMWSALAVYTTWQEIMNGNYQSVRSVKK